MGQEDAGWLLQLHDIDKQASRRTTTAAGAAAATAAIQVEQKLEHATAEMGQQPSQQQ
jgi:hypothetical protein